MSNRYCVTDHDFDEAKFRESFNLKKFNEVEGKEKYRVDVSKSFAALGNLDIARAREVTEGIKISPEGNAGYYELMKQKPWFDELSSVLLDQRKQAKMQWLEDPSEIIGDYLNNTPISPEVGRHFRDKNTEYLTSKINEPATNSKNKNIRDMYRRIN
jgi:hypothetical protein